jgi:hypothetical protein
MEALKGKIFTHHAFQNLLIRVVDLVNIDGPLLTLYLHADKQLYLFDWVDRDTTANRWLIYRTNPLLLNQFVKGDISHLDLLLGDEPFVLTTDIDKNLNWHNCKIVDKKDLPNRYLPTQDILFDKAHCANYQKLWVFINLESTQPPSGGFFLL